MVRRPTLVRRVITALSGVLALGFIGIGGGAVAASGAIHPAITNDFTFLTST